MGHITYVVILEMDKYINQFDYNQTILYKTFEYFYK